MPRQLVSKVLPLIAVLAASARADVVTLEASKDATLFNSATGAVANGGAFSFYVGRTGPLSTEPVRRGLLAFDVASAIPSGSTITAVQLTLYMSMTTSGSKVVDMLRVTTQWNEGTTVGFSGQGGASQTGDVTWLHTNKPSAFWTTPGGDFVGAVSATRAVDQAGFYTWNSTAALVSDVQGWLNAPSTNCGWLLRGPETGSKSAKRFEARESLAQYRPMLQVTYTLPPPASYCTAKTNSSGCLPAIGSSGTPDANAGSGFTISLANTLNQKQGLLFYGTSGPNAVAFQGGIFCVQSPTKRTPVQSSGGNPTPPADCSGAFGYDFNVRIASGVDPALVAGAEVWAQYWSRDPADPFTTNLSDGLHFYISP